MCVWRDDGSWVVPKKSLSCVKTQTWIHMDFITCEHTELNLHKWKLWNTKQFSRSLAHCSLKFIIPLKARARHTSSHNHYVHRCDRMPRISKNTQPLLVLCNFRSIEPAIKFPAINRACSNGFLWVFCGFPGTTWRIITHTKKSSEVVFWII